MACAVLAALLAAACAQTLTTGNVTMAAGVGENAALLIATPIDVVAVKTARIVVGGTVGGATLNCTSDCFIFDANATQVGAVAVRRPRARAGGAAVRAVTRARALAAHRAPDPQPRRARGAAPSGRRWRR